MRLPHLALRVINALRLTLLRRSGLNVGVRVMTYGAPLIQRHAGSEIVIGDGVVLCSDSRYTALALNHVVKISTLAPDARISIGRDSGISGATIVCARSISLGAEVLLGANVVIMDTDFHPIAPENRRHSDDARRIGVAPVEIGDNVFVGMEAVVLKGAHIRRDSVVAARAVVARGDYPEGAILSGNPAKVIGSVYDRAQGDA